MTTRRRTSPLRQATPAQIEMLRGLGRRSRELSADVARAANDLDGILSEREAQDLQVAGVFLDITARCAGLVVLLEARNREAEKDARGGQ